MLELINVEKEYPSPVQGGAVSILNDISLKVESGSSLAIVGPSGCGKSTLLNIIGGLDRPTSGRVLVDDVDISVLGDKELAKVRNEQIGFVFQLHHLLPQCTVIENVLIPTLAGGGKVSDKKVLEQRAVELLGRVGLKDWQYHRPAELSSGQRQRVAVVRALINEPKLLLADEPTGALDAKAAENISQLLRELNEAEKVTLIVVTHSDRIAGQMSRVLEFDDGKLIGRQNSK